MKYLKFIYLKSYYQIIYKKYNLGKFLWNIHKTFNGADNWFKQ